ncbi:ldc gene product [Bradyrhizobium oligotrophicum S58]|uniref:ornithine decarboxylase n=1 Tax=Bradyrhizobium oligotrophicum S58 TaxID=1245469 RepID=M4ZHD4_9BRAD|nr:ldc gene product [Bradyrhizobium oligotrophicum]BAM93204.1 ldc gene product [Bradyrhizobium oligotrophicum S58]
MACPHANVEALLSELQPSEPMLCVWPDRIAAQLRRFQGGFPGEVLYAIKANPLASVLRTLCAAGLRHFDVASIAEIEAVTAIRRDAGLFFHNPVKSRDAIRVSASLPQIHSFAVDHADELAKCMAETDRRDIQIAVRMATQRADAAQDFSTKFGAAPAEAAQILRAAHQAGFACGLTFHVGTQCRNPQAYSDALAACGEIAAVAGVPLASIDVGGGFPAAHEGEIVPPLETYFDAIGRSFRDLHIEGCRLLCEPGRALVAQACAVLVQVVHRRDGRLHINDGVAGSFGELSFLDRRVPARLYRRRGTDVRGVDGEPTTFTLVGPLAFDTRDELPGRYALPADAREGDWILLGELGAYATCLAADFLAYRQPLDATVAEWPWIDARERDHAA